MISILMDQMTSTRFGIDCQDCQIRHKAICANSDADKLAQLNSFKTYTRYQPNEMITYSGDPMDYVGTLVTGMAEISMALEDGRRQILGLLMPGDFIGRPDRLYCKYDIKALEHIHFCRFDRKDFRSLLARSPTLSQRLYEMTMDELDATRDWMLLLGRKTAREKLASLLFLIAIKQQGLSPLSHHQNFEFDLLLTREMIADYLGMRVETVSRQITVLKSKGIIRVTGQRHISGPDINALLAETGDPQMAEMLGQNNQNQRGGHRFAPQ